MLPYVITPIIWTRIAGQRKKNVAEMQMVDATSKIVNVVLLQDLLTYYAMQIST